jgi:hypothetical protein
VEPATWVSRKLLLEPAVSKVSLNSDAEADEAVSAAATAEKNAELFMGG